MNTRIRVTASDWFLSASVGVGLFFSPATLLILAAPLFRSGRFRPQDSAPYNLMLLSILWALGVVAMRGVGDGRSVLLQYAFIWTLPFLMLIYSPTGGTVTALKRLVLCLFALDLAFNLYAAVTGMDLLGRVQDTREGLTGARLGGLFGHSFYSGTISTLALAFAACQRRLRWVAVFAVSNLLLAGSLRLAVPIVLIPLFLWRWQSRSRAVELAMVGTISALAIFGTIATSSLSDFDVEANAANDVRIFAWATAIESVFRSPMQGVGYPQLSAEDGINFETIEENLIGESWYLNSAITFGVPYVALRLASLLVLFYGIRFKQRSVYEAVLAPYFLIDLVYGGSFEGTLIYCVLWAIVCHQPGANQNSGAQAQETGQRPIKV